MSPKILQDYFDEIDQLLRNSANIYVEEFKVSSLTSERANLRLKVRFAFKYLLAVSEIIVVVDNQIEYIDYRYHFQDAQNNLIFRYDSTP
ncbi:MAG: toxin TumE, partial [Pseudanabaena sp.]